MKRGGRDRVTRRGGGRGRVNSRNPPDPLSHTHTPLVSSPPSHSYYTVPFHCYPEGNLAWDAALEVEASARAVHAPVMHPGPPATAPLSPDGDADLRAAISAASRALMVGAGVDPDALGGVAVDVGCSTGLSSRELARAFPGLGAIAGLDLSPHMLAVASHLASARPLPRAVPLTLIHAAFEDSGLVSASVGLVSIVLVAHECPRSVTAAFLAEAWRVLRPGGVVVVADMDPASPAFQALAANPFAYAGFKSSEPHLLEWVGLGFAGVEAAARGMGFVGVGSAAATPRHAAMVAVKPKEA